MAGASTAPGVVPGTMNPFGRTARETDARAWRNRSALYALLAILLLAGAGTGFVLMRRAPADARPAALSEAPAVATASPPSASPSRSATALAPLGVLSQPPTPQAPAEAVAAEPMHGSVENAAPTAPLGVPAVAGKHAGARAPGSATHGAAAAGPMSNAVSTNASPVRASAAATPLAVPQAPVAALPRPTVDPNAAGCRSTGAERGLRSPLTTSMRMAFAFSRKSGSLRDGAGPRGRARTQPERIRRLRHFGAADSRPELARGERRVSEKYPPVIQKDDAGFGRFMRTYRR